MSQDEEQQRRSRVVVETPTARREVIQTQTRRVPERSGYSAGVIAAVALTAIAATAIIFLFLMNRGDEETTTVNINARPTATPLAPVIVQQPPTPLPTPVVIQQTMPPVVTTQPAPVVLPPVTTTAPPVPAPTASAPDDATVLNNVSRKIQDDPDLSTTGVLADIHNGRATLTGSVKSQDLKRRAERLAMSVKGVRTVDNQITVAAAAPDAAATP